MITGQEEKHEAVSLHWLPVREWENGQSDNLTGPSLSGVRGRGLSLPLLSPTEGVIINLVVQDGTAALLRAPANAFFVFTLICCSLFLHSLLFLLLLMAQIPGLQNVFSSSCQEQAASLPLTFAFV